MTIVLGVNAVFHDPAAALVVDGRTVASIEEARFARRGRKQRPVECSTWQLPRHAARHALELAGITPSDVDAIAYAFDPELAPGPSEDLGEHAWDSRRSTYALRAPHFLEAELPGLDLDRVRFVPHHVAHAHSALGRVGYDEPAAVLVLDGRGERASGLLGRASGGRLKVLATQDLPHSLGLLYEELTEHLGFRALDEEHRTMAIAERGSPVHLPEMRRFVRTTKSGGYQIGGLDLSRFAPPCHGGAAPTAQHADLAASVQARLEEVVLELARWLHAATAANVVAVAGGIAHNHLITRRLAAEGPFRAVHVAAQPGDAGSALGAALHVATLLSEDRRPSSGALAPPVADPPVAVSPPGIGALPLR